MPTMTPHTEAALDALTVVTARGLYVHVRARDTATAVCDLSFTRAELRTLLDRADVLASLDDTAEHAALGGN